jgi:hypothetical protein
MVASESPVGEAGGNIPSSSDEEGCIDMMRVENKRCQVVGRVCMASGQRSTGHCQQPLDPNRGINEARVSRHVHGHHLINICNVGHLFSHSNFRGAH